MSAVRDVVGEALGTFVLVAVGTSSVALAVLDEPVLTAAWQVAAVWGVGVFVAILVASRFSRAHLNPAVTLAVATTRPDEFPRAALPRHWLGQLAGAVAAGLLVLGLFGGRLAAFETAHGLVRGAAGSERAAMIFGEFFPNPAAPPAQVSPLEAFLAEAGGTAALVLVAFAAADAATARGWKTWKPAAIVGAAVAAIILVVGPVTQAGLNPARDFGPRLVAWIAGYDAVAIPGPRGGFWVYLAGPCVGATTAAFAYEFVRRSRRATEKTGMTRVPEILFVCVHNAGRSQMAAAFARRLGGDGVRVRSAGSLPAERVHPVVVEAMRELGIDLASEVPKLLAPDAVRAADVVVTMGCGDACPVFPGKRYEDWTLDDPKGRSLDDVRRVRDEIRSRVEGLLAWLAVPRRPL